MGFDLANETGEEVMWVTSRREDFKSWCVSLHSVLPTATPGKPTGLVLTQPHHKLMEPVTWVSEDGPGC